MEETAVPETPQNEQGNSVPAESVDVIEYKITPNRLTTYVHYRQFWPVLIVMFVVLTTIFCVCDKWLWPLVLLSLAVFFGLYSISTRIAAQRIASTKYTRNGNTISASNTYFGFYSKKAIELEQVSRISLIQTPLMKFCDVWAIEFMTTANTRVQIYGIKGAADVHRQLVEARAVALAAIHHK
ncbi:MAG: hypothetical protein K6B46_01630 [Opitutales bacterium]|nr:hypothetical protein [Opitutales bacterium]